MRQTYLEVTFRKGRPLAAYLYLPRRAGDAAARTERDEGGLLVDYSSDGRPIGIEITAPARLSLSALNRVLARTHQQLASAEDLSPLAVGA